MNIIYSFIIAIVVFAVCMAVCIYRLVLIFKYNDENSKIAVGHFTEIVRNNLLFIPIWINYTYKYEVDDKTYTKQIGLPSLMGFSQQELDEGIEVRYFIDKPKRATLGVIKTGVKAFGWSILIAGCLAIIIISSIHIYNTVNNF